MTVTRVTTPRSIHMDSTTIIRLSDSGSMIRGTGGTVVGTITIHSFVEPTILPFTRAGPIGGRSGMDTIRTTIRILETMVMHMATAEIMGQPERSERREEAGSFVKAVAAEKGP